MDDMPQSAALSLNERVMLQARQRSQANRTTSANNGAKQYAAKLSLNERVMLQARRQAQVDMGTSSNEATHSTPAVTRVQASPDDILRRLKGLKEDFAKLGMQQHTSKSKSIRHPTHSKTYESGPSADPQSREELPTNNQSSETAEDSADIRLHSGSITAPAKTRGRTRPRRVRPGALPHQHSDSSQSDDLKRGHQHSDSNQFDDHARGPETFDTPSEFASHTPSSDFVAWHRTQQQLYVEQSAHGTSDNMDIEFRVNENRSDKANLASLFDRETGIGQRSNSNSKNKRRTAERRSGLGRGNVAPIDVNKTRAQQRGGQSSWSSTSASSLSFDRSPIADPSRRRQREQRDVVEHNQDVDEEKTPSSSSSSSSFSDAEVDAFFNPGTSAPNLTPRTQPRALLRRNQSDRRDKKSVMNKTIDTDLKTRENDGIGASESSSDSEFGAVKSIFGTKAPLRVSEDNSGDNTSPREANTKYSDASRLSHKHIPMELDSSSSSDSDSIIQFHPSVDVETRASSDRSTQRAGPRVVGRRRRLPFQRSLSGRTAPMPTESVDVVTTPTPHAFTATSTPQRATEVEPQIVSLSTTPAPLSSAIDSHMGTTSFLPGSVPEPRPVENIQSAPKPSVFNDDDIPVFAVNLNNSSDRTVGGARSKGRRGYARTRPSPRRGTTENKTVQQQQQHGFETPNVFFADSTDSTDRPHEEHQEPPLHETYPVFNMGISSTRNNNNSEPFPQVPHNETIHSTTRDLKSDGQVDSGVSFVRQADTNTTSVNNNNKESSLHELAFAPGVSTSSSTFTGTSKRGSKYGRHRSGSVRSKEATVRSKATKLRELGNTLYKAQQYSKALVAYNEACELQPTNTTHWTNRAAAKMMLHQHRAAYDDCCAATKLDEGAARAWLRGGNILASYGLWSQARRWLRKAGAIERECKRADPGASSSPTKGNVADTVRVRISDMARCEANVESAKRMLRDGRGAAALRFAEQALTFGTKAPALYVLCAAANHCRDVSRWRSGEELKTSTSKYLSEAVKLAAAWDTSQSFMDTHVGDLAVEFGSAMNRSNLLEEAHEFLSLVASYLDKASIRAHNAAKVAGMGSGSAESPSSKSTDGSVSGRLFHAAAVHATVAQLAKLRSMHQASNTAFRKGDYDTALHGYSDALRLQHASVHYRAKLLCNRAAVYMALRVYSKAVNDCAAALALKPLFHKARLRRGRALRDSGKLRDALQEFERVYRQEPTPEVGEELRDLRTKLRTQYSNHSTYSSVPPAACQSQSSNNSNTSYGYGKKNSGGGRRRTENTHSQQQQHNNSYSSYNKTHGGRSGSGGGSGSGSSGRESSATASLKQQTHYQVLGLTASASDAEVRKAYKLGALKNHPDKNGDDKSKTELFKRMVEAYAVLKDSTKRREYDAKTRYRTSVNTGGGAGGFSTRYGSGGASSRPTSNGPGSTYGYAGGGKSTYGNARGTTSSSSSSSSSYYYQRKYF